MKNYKEKTYRLVSILDREGNRRADVEPRHADFYRNLEGCIARNIREDTSFYRDGTFARVDVIQDPCGRWINHNFKTSPLEEIRELDDGGLELITMRSVYRFEPAEMVPPVYQDAANLIELYMTVDNYQFCNGYFYDDNKEPHQLSYYVHAGMFQDSVLVRREDALMGDYVCRYFPLGTKIKFYNTLYREQNYAYPMLIHNTSDVPIKIEFEYLRATWTILPGESRMITPGSTEGADPGSTEPRKQTT